MHVEATVRFEPMLNRWVLMRRVVIDNEVQIKFVIFTTKIEVKSGRIRSLSI
jgi:hypothetical protein